MIRMENVTFGYGDRPVLKNVSFHIPSGESRVILGPSGSGKSTILRLLLGLECPWEGDVLIDGTSICGMGLKQLREIRKRIGMVFQDGGLFDSSTVGENIAFYPFEYSEKGEEEIEREVRQMLEFVNLDPDIIDSLPDELSGGMRRRVAIARALLSTDPKLMLFDEPTTGLDPQATQKVLALINKLQEVKKVSVVIVTHHIADALKLADKFIVIREGEIVFDGDVESFRLSKSEKVQSFLAPFRESIEEVVKRNLLSRE